MEARATKVCPTDDEIAAWVDRALDVEASERVARHVDGCVDCRAIVTALGRVQFADEAATIADRKQPPAPPSARRTLARGETIGRFIVLDRLGDGAMGTVHAAYDPKLDRRVAIKLLHAHLGGSDAARASMLREARAIARINHPNVVGVHEVGMFEGDVFLALELVEGVNVKRWLREDDPAADAIFDVFLAAGRGLGAAHRAGVIHRDFKPENVLRGNDGRVRVTDFGVARAEPSGATDADASGEMIMRTRAGSVVGTPAFMSPEQHAAAPVDARTDQFAFCVSLLYALDRALPFEGKTEEELARAKSEGRLRPRGKNARASTRVRRVLVRGLAADPSQRWPSMEALLDALEEARRRVPKRAWRALAGVSLLAAVAAVPVARAAARRSRVAECNAEASRVDAVWNDGKRAEVRAAFAHTGRPFAGFAADDVVRAIDDWTARWRASTTSSCTSTRVAHAQSDERYLVRNRCLLRRLDELTATLDLFTHADAVVVENASASVRDLTAVERCDDVDRLTTEPEPPADTATKVKVEAARKELDRARALLEAGKYGDGLDVAKQARAAADVGWAPLVAQADLLRGELAVNAGDVTQGGDALHAAYFGAIAAGDDSTAARAASDLVRVVGVTGGQHEAGDDWALQAHALLARAPDAVIEGDLSSALGALRWHEGRYDDALAEDRRALALLEKSLPAGTPKLAHAHEDVANALFDVGRYDEAVTEATLARDQLLAALGPNHPAYAAALNTLAGMFDTMGREDEALTNEEQALDIRERTLGPDHLLVAESYYFLAYIHRAREEDELALPLSQHALDIREKTLGPEHSDVGQVLVELSEIQRNLGRIDEAIASARRALAIQEKTQGKAHMRYALALLSLGDALVEKKETADGVAALEEAETVAEKTLGAKNPSLSYFLLDEARGHIAAHAASRAIEELHRAIATPLDGSLFVSEAHAALADALWQMGEHEEATKTARTALDELHGAYTTKLRAKIEAWLAGHVT